MPPSCSSLIQLSRYLFKKYIQLILNQLPLLDERLIPSFQIYTTFSGMEQTNYTSNHSTVTLLAKLRG